MTLTPSPDGTSHFVVELTEWNQVGPAQDLRLKGRSLEGDTQSRRLAEALRGRLDIRERLGGGGLFRRIAIAARRQHEQCGG